MTGKLFATASLNQKHYSTAISALSSAARPRGRRPQGQRAVASVQHKADENTHVQEKQTYLGETFWQIQPLKKGQQADYRHSANAQQAPEIKLQSLNHASLEAADVQGLSDFYTSILGFKSIDRPDFPFDGAWLEGAGLLLHIISEDPSVPKSTQSWKDKFTHDPETWYIRRSNHLAFEVENADAMEARLVFYGIEYTKAVVPDTDASQLFFFDPEGHGVEVGCDYAQVTAMLRARLGMETDNTEAAVSP